MPDEKQKNYIRDNYKRRTPEEIAEKTGLPLKEVEKEITSIIMRGRGGTGIKLILLILAPLIFLVLLEVSLRIAGMYQAYPLLIQKEIDGKKVFELNKDVARRWFLNPNTAVPELNNTIRYTADKPDSLYRVIFLGGSTTAGFPYDNLPPFPTLFRLLFKDLRSERKIEAVNLGISAINSFSVLDIAEESLVLKPDAVVVYMGHNEFYGAFGAASSQGASSFLPARFVLFLNRFAVVQNIRRLINKITPRKRASRRNKTLMAQMISDTYIPYEGNMFNKAGRNFSENYSALVNFYRSKDIPVITSTLVSNLRDHYPFRSAWRNNEKEKKELFRKALGKPDSLAFKDLIKLYNADSTHAGLLFELGKYYLRRKDRDNARKFFLKAKERDGLRFRAPEAWNRIIAECSRENKIPLVRMDSIFCRNSPDGIPGKNLFLEHLHPNWEGYYLMARSFAEKFVSLGWIKTDKDISGIKSLKEHLWYNLTDEEIGRQKAAILSGGWPFNKEEFRLEKYHSGSPSFIINEVNRYLHNNSPWNKLHFRIAENFIREKNYDGAVRQYLGVAAYLPDYEFPLDKAGLLFILKGNYRGAFYLYRKLLKINPENPYYYCRAGQALAMDGIIPEAIKYLEKGIADDVARGRKIAGRDFYQFKFWLGYCYANNRQLYFAERQLRQVLKKYPGHIQAQSLLKQILAVKKR